MKQGLITFIPKAGKDRRILDNLRPITLLNTDYKILSGVIAARLKEGISSIISETQSGFLKGRLIHNNIRLVLDLLDYNQMVQERGFILFLDFYKAFDSEFCKKYQLQCNVKYYDRILKAIPSSLRAMVREDTRYSAVSPVLSQFCIEGLDFCDFKCNNKVIKNLLIKKYYPNPVKRFYILKDFEVEKIKKIRKNYISFPLPPKVKEVNFKILNEIYPTNEFLRLRFNFDLNNCVFCTVCFQTYFKLTSIYAFFTLLFLITTFMLCVNFLYVNIIPVIKTV
uniref:Reverse transcriptase domain-containing protein n=1 Tax=Cyprinus carpio carpio TaxID=630221 RepID=A0A9J8APK5_CYPCA